MRTTIVIQEDLTKKIKSHIQQKKLSQFIDLCIREHYELENKKKQREALAAAYHQASKEEDPDNNFDLIDIEDWPE
ncbi:MAG: hypothetical protein HQM15_06645 [Deltaproteobacteria bacterium]|nr:hypothetical protein [Deltaproteobacteria bacterium]